jgi:GTPase SAR1 family protein
MSENTNDEIIDEILIDLTKDLLPNQINAKNLIHRQEFNDIFKRIRKFCESSSEKSETKLIDRFVLTDIKQNTFFINGTRGSGKTTFMMSLVERLCKPNEEPKVSLLAWFDPTMIETGENVFFSLIQYLKNLIEEKKKSLCNWDEPDTDYEKWRKQLQRLGKGLSLLQKDKDENKLKYYDAILQLDESMKKAQGGGDLAKDFHELLKTSASILKVDYFIIAFDDADMKLKEGWEILELIRKYLRSSRIITIITGDLELYKHIVKIQFKNELKLEKQGEDPRVIKLADEYLLKLFLPKNCIKLSELKSLITRPIEKYAIKLILNNENRQILLSEAFNKLTGYYMSSGNKNDQKNYADVVFKGSTRKLIEILKDEKEKL